MTQDIAFRLRGQPIYGRHCETTRSRNSLENEKHITITRLEKPQFNRPIDKSDISPMSSSPCSMLSLILSALPL